MAQQNWWDSYEEVPSAPAVETLPERKMGADITQSGASAANAAASAEETKALLPSKVRKAEADAAVAEAEAETKVAKTEDRNAAALRSFRGVLDAIDDVAVDSDDGGGWFETGTTGSVMRDYGPKGGTAAADLAAKVKTIDANSAFAELQKMRENSPTGGALGNITIPELDLLKSTIASIDPNLSQPEFLRQLTKAKKHYVDMLRYIDPKEADEYLTANKPGLRYNTERDEWVLVRPGGDVNAEPIDPFGVRSGGGAPPAGGGGSAPGGGGSGGGGGSPPDAPTNWSLGGIAHRLGQGAGSIVEGVGNTLGMLGGNALGTLAYRAAGYDKPYEMGEELRKLVGLPNNDTGTDAAIQGGTMAMSGAGLGRGLASVAQPGAWKNALSIVGATPVRDAAAGAAAGGAGQLAADAGGGPTAQTLAALGGGLVGYGGASALNLERMFAGKAPTQLAEIAARQGVDLSAADVGGPATRILSNAARSSPISAGTVVKAAQRSNEELRDAATRAAQSQGSVPATDVAGESVREAAKRLTAKTKDIGNTNYTRAFEEAGPLQIPARGAIAKIDEMLGKLTAAPGTNKGAIEELTRLKGDLAKGLTAEQMHGLRSEISGGVFDGKLRSGTDQGRMKAIRGALTDDMLGYLKSNGLTRAASRIEKADKYWADRVEHIDQVLQPIIGQDGMKGGEQVVQTIESMARGGNGGNKRLSRLLANMTGEERGEVTSTLIDRLGKATAGQQDDLGNVFSPSTFLTNWNKMTRQAKSTLFRDESLRRNLDDIAKLADGMRATQKLANHSNTGASVLGNVAIQGGWAASHLPSYLIGAGAQYLTGRMLASPKFTRWLARAPKYEDPRKALDGLALVAAREPALQNDVGLFQRHLEQSLTRSPGGASAEEERD